MEVDGIERPSVSSWSMGLGISQLSDVERVKAVYIFLLRDTVKHNLLVNVRGKGQLHQDAVDFGVGVEFIYLGAKLLLGYLGREIL